jgi:hypothetical protein
MMHIFGELTYYRVSCVYASQRASPRVSYRFVYWLFCDKVFNVISAS